MSKCPRCGDDDHDGPACTCRMTSPTKPSACFLWFHDWDKWGELIEQTWVSYGTAAFPHEERKEIKFCQERTCKRCGAKQRRMVQ